MSPPPKPSPRALTLLMSLGGLLLLTPLLLVRAAWIGHKTLPVEVQAVDENSGEPIAGAHVRLGEGGIDPRSATIRWRSEQPPPPTATSQTGGAVLNVPFMVTGVDYLWSYSGMVGFGATCIETSAPGYRTRRVDLQTLAGLGRKDDPELWPLRVVVALEKSDEVRRGTQETPE